MAITYDEGWIAGHDSRTRVKRVYRNSKTIGQVRRWYEGDPSGLNREWFTAEHLKDGLYVPIEGVQTDFLEALERVVFFVGSQ